MDIRGLNIFGPFSLQRVCYTATEEGKSPGYTCDTLAWLCPEHVKDGLNAAKLESYPCQVYHNAEYDKHRGDDWKRPMSSPLNISPTGTKM